MDTIKAIGMAKTMEMAKAMTKVMAKAMAMEMAKAIEMAKTKGNGNVMVRTPMAGVEDLEA